MRDEEDTGPVDGAIYHCETFSDPDDLMPKLEDSLFRFCSLFQVSPFGGYVTSVFLSTRFDRVDWYSGLFTVCDFLDCRFENCTFRGTSFPHCRFVDCRFEGCRFVPDNLGGDCVFGGAKWYGCLQSCCEGLPDEVRTLGDGKGESGSRG